MLRHLLRQQPRRCSGFCSPRTFWSTCSRHSGIPNAPLDLDPSLRELLRDADLSLLKHRSRQGSSDVLQASTRRELEVFPNDPSPEVEYLTPEELDLHDDQEHDKEHRKSPAALFVSQRIGSVIIPLELQDTITRLIAGTCILYWSE